MGMAPGDEPECENGGNPESGRAQKNGGTSEPREQYARESSHGPAYRLAIGAGGPAERTGLPVLASISSKLRTLIRSPLRS